MAKKSCYICNKETEKSKNVFNERSLELCFNCESRLNSFTSELVNFAERSTEKRLGLRVRSDKNIKRNIIEAKRRIAGDEKIVDYLFDLTLSGFTSGGSFDLGVYTGMVLLTTKRLILFIPNSGTLGEFMGCKFEYSAQLEDVIEIIIQRNIINSTFSIRDKGGNFKATNNLKLVDSDSNVQRFISNFNSQKNENSKSASTQLTQIIQQSDNLDKIKKLKEMLDLGILTTEEYETKKKQLLDGL